jgi:hypothetical protein
MVARRAGRTALLRDGFMPAPSGAAAAAGTAWALTRREDLRGPGRGPGERAVLARSSDQGLPDIAAVAPVQPAPEDESP